MKLGTFRLWDLHTDHCAKKSLKAFWWGWKKNKKAGFKLNIQKTNIMAHSPSISRQIEGRKVETVIDFILLGFKITVEGDGSNEINKNLLLKRKAMPNLDSVLKTKNKTNRKTETSFNWQRFT